MCVLSPRLRVLRRSPQLHWHHHVSCTLRTKGCNNIDRLDADRLEPPSRAPGLEPRRASTFSVFTEGPPGGASVHRNGVRAVRAARWAVSKFTQQQHLSTRCAVYGCDDVHCERAQPCFMRDVACARVWMAALGLGLEWRRCTLLECSRPASIRLGSAPDADCLKATGKT